MNIVFVYYTLVMTDSQSTEYYFLPVELILLLVDKIPLYRRDIYKTIPFFAKHPKVYTQLIVFKPCSFVHELYGMMTDAIRRNEIDFIRQYYSTTGIDEREHAEILWDNRSFVAQCGIYTHYWCEAVKHSRIEIMEFFYEIDSNASSPVYNPISWNASNMGLINVIPNPTVMEWFLTTNHEKPVSRLWIREITYEIIDRQYMSCLRWLHSHNPKKRAGPIEHSYLEAAICTYGPGRHNHQIDRITTKPEILEWCKLQRWNLKIDWNTGDVR
jgi:hypothetical protein